eukprot:5566189-Amphidinium_carterae.1
MYDVQPSRQCDIAPGSSRLKERSHVAMASVLQDLHRSRTLRRTQGHEMSRDFVCRVMVERGVRVASGR